MKKAALLFVLVFALTGCSKKADIDELISVYELPQYSNSVEIEVSDTEENDDNTSSEDVISID